MRLEGKSIAIIILSISLCVAVGLLVFIQIRFNQGLKIENSYTLDKTVLKDLTKSQIKDVSYGGGGYTKSLVPAKILSVPWKALGFSDDKQVIAINVSKGSYAPRCVEEGQLPTTLPCSYSTESDINSSLESNFTHGVVVLKQPLGNRKLYHGKLGEAKLS
jgi:hypothetical protein